MDPDFNERHLDALADETEVGTDWVICPECQGNGCGCCNGSGEISAPVEAEEA